MFTPPEYLTSPSQIREGATWVWARLSVEAEWQRLADNVRPKTDPPGPTPVNWYRRISSFWSGALWSQPPMFEQPLPESWVPPLIAASDQRSAKGIGVVRLSGERLTPVDTSHYFPIVDPMDVTVTTHHVIAIPFASKGALGSFREPADRISITVYPIDPEIPTSTAPRAGAAETGKPPSPARGSVVTDVYILDGDSLGRRVSRRPTAWQTIATWGDWTSDYVDPKPILDLFEERLSKVHVSLNHHNEPHIAGPAAAMPAAGQSMLAWSEGMFLPRDREDPPWEYVQPGADGYIPSFTELRWLEDQLHILTSIPATVFGKAEDQRAQVSGAARERQMYAALQKIRRLRAEVLPALRALTGSSAPIDWPDDPFATYHERADTLVKLAQAEIISAEQAQARIHE